VLASLQRSGSRCIPATPADGYFRYIAESIVNADFTEAKRSKQDAKLRVVLCFYQEYTLPINSSGAILRCFVICELRVIVVLVNARIAT
jgi:hypothetical protein